MDPVESEAACRRSRRRDQRSRAETPGTQCAAFAGAARSRSQALISDTRQRCTVSRKRADHPCRQAGCLRLCCRQRPELRELLRERPEGHQQRFSESFQ